MRDDRLLAERIPFQFGGYPTLPHDEHAVGQPDDFGQFGRDDDDGFAFGGQLLDQAVNLCLGAYVDSPGRLIEEEDLRTRRDPAGDDRLLLVAAAEQADRPVELKRTQVDARQNRRGDTPEFPAPDDPTRGEASHRGKRDVVDDGALRNDPVALALLRYEADPGGDRRPRVARVDAAPIEFDETRCRFVGAGDEARALVRPGDCAVIAGAPLELRNGRIASRALDNRIGAYVALEVARRAAAAGTPGDVAGLAVVQEEVGDFAGSRTVAWELEPAVAIAVDVTYATDVRGGDPEEDGEHKLGSGAVIMRGPSIHPRVFELLHETAEAEEIPFTIEVSRGSTSTDADAVYLSRRGVATGLVSVPLRSMHTPVETIQLDDVEAAVALIVAFARRLEPGVSFAR